MLPLSEPLDGIHLMNDKMIEMYNDLKNQGYHFTFLKSISAEKEHSDFKDLWTCRIVQKEVEIKCYENVPSSNFLAHELLHVHLDSLGFSDFKTISQNLFINRDGHNVNALPHQYISLINNNISHFLMMPLFVALGFDAREFSRDYEQAIVYNERLESIISNLPKGFPNESVPEFIRLYFEAKFHPNPAFNSEINYLLGRLNEINASLYRICNDFAITWMQSGDATLNYRLFDEFSLRLENWIGYFYLGKK